VLEVIATPDAPQSFALVRRHRCAITTISTWPTRNAAHDAMYDELRAIILPRRSRRLDRVVTIGGSVSACLTLVAVALAGLLWLGASIDPGGAYDGAPYVITLDH
jgi:hypothetical protein